MRTIRTILLGLILGVSGHGARAAEKPISCPPNQAGDRSEKVIVVGPEGAAEFGLKTYPRTLALADHEVVLTFDDGPSRQTTPAVLDALEAACVHATFFLIGRNAAAAPDLVRREIRDGDTVGHHSFSHPEITLRGLPDAAARADIDRGIQADDKAGYGTASAEPRVPFFRFPGFADTQALDSWLAARHIEVFGADLWASDWVPMTPAKELALLLSRLETAGRGIILLHDVKAQTAAMLPDFLAALKQRGYRVVHMVPGHVAAPVAEAPSGWHSETEATIAQLWPKLVKEGARTPMPAGGGPTP